MAIINFDSENLVVDWLSFNIKNSMNPKPIATYFSKLGLNSTFKEGSNSKDLISKKENKFHVLFLKQTYNPESKNFWDGTTLIFSGSNANYFYQMMKTKKLNWSVFDLHHLTLSRLDLSYFRKDSGKKNTSDQNKHVEFFMQKCCQKIHTKSKRRHASWSRSSKGLILKIGNRQSPNYYRVYQKDQKVRFEIELKHRQTKLVQDYLFQNQLDVFEDQLVIQYFQYSKRVLCLDYIYTDWIVDFQRRHQRNPTSRSSVTSYLENQRIKNQEERLFHLLQFLSFVKSLKLNPFKDCKKHRIKKQNYYSLKFPLSQFVEFMGIKISNHSERKKLIFYFYQLQKLDPIVKVFSNKAFRSYVCFPYVECENPLGNSWSIEVLAAEELFYFPYPFQLPESFLRSVSKNDLRLKVRLMKSLAVSEREKTLDLEEFFNRINLPNNQLIQIKKSLIKLLSELFENKIIQNEMKIILKSGKKKDRLIRNLTTSDITRRIQYIKFHEIFV